MAPNRFLRWLAAHPVGACGVVALLLRTVLVLHAWDTNPLVRTPQTDGAYYMTWAVEIADGDVLGRSGIIGGKPWMLNPLYAYVLAPFVRWFADSHLPALLFQAVLGAGTTALAAAAARRFFDVRAGWVAGTCVAFAAPLAQLDAHIAVAGLSAFLVAGACFACAPKPGGTGRSLGGPVAAGLWLGVGALARPITPLALPFVAWRFSMGTPRRWRAGLVVIAAFAACAVPSLLRNWIVSGEPAVYTAAGGINAHLGNNPVARRYRAMTSDHFEFSPLTMHEDGRRYVHEAVGHPPSAGEISGFFWRMAIDECVQRPIESAAFYANKARWFFGPVEVPSSASLASDRSFSPLLAFAFVPAWIIASLALAGAWAHRRRADVLLGPGALALAHWAMLTLVFPLSHYRAPAIPALAVLAGGAVAAVWTAWADGRRGSAARVVCIGALAAVAGACPPGPDPLAMRDEGVLAWYHGSRGEFAEGERRAWASLEAYRRQWNEDSAASWQLIGDLQQKQRKWDESRTSLTRSLELSPANPKVRVLRSVVSERLGDFIAAEADARKVAERYPFLPDGWLRLGEVLSLLDESRHPEAAEALRRAIDRGATPAPATLRRVRFKR